MMALFAPDCVLLRQTFVDHLAHRFGQFVRLAMVFLVGWGCVVLASPNAYALEPNAEGYFVTGSGVRTKNVGFVRVKVYAIRHEMKKLPPSKTKQAVVDADVDKRFSWRMLRELEAEAIKGALRAAYQRNGYSDSAKIEEALSAFSVDLVEGATVSITYDATKKTTAFQVQSGARGGAATTVSGTAFMTATWSIWFGKTDQPTLADALLANL